MWLNSETVISQFSLLRLDCSPCVASFKCRCSSRCWQPCSAGSAVSYGREQQTSYTLINGLEVVAQVQRGFAFTEVDFLSLMLMTWVAGLHDCAWIAMLQTYLNTTVTL
eukprot:2369148-Amphidinium_carterae.1